MHHSGLAERLKPPTENILQTTRAGDLTNISTNQDVNKHDVVSVTQQRNHHNIAQPEAISQDSGSNNW